MGYHVTDERVVSQYAYGIDDAWTSWKPGLTICERLLHADYAINDSALDDNASADDQCYLDDEERLADFANQIRRAQYRAHTTSEFALGLIPPPSALNAHQTLIELLIACRDTLSLIAERAEENDLDEELTAIGYEAITLTRNAFAAARTSNAMIQAWSEDYERETQILEGSTTNVGSRLLSILIWSTIISAAAFLIVLFAEAFLFS